MSYGSRSMVLEASLPWPRSAHCANVTADEAAPVADPMKKTAHLPFLLLALAAGSGACSRSVEQGPRTSAVLVTLDTTRADALGCLGGADGTTPVLDGFARRAVLWSAARTVAPLTMPAHASMFTGLYPPRHGVRDNNLAALPDEARTTAELALAAGLRTAAFVSSVAVDRAFGFDQGFEHYDQPTADADPGHHVAQRRGFEAVDAALAWLAGLQDGERYFLWVHLFDPHAPYEPPAPFRDRMDDPYLGEVAATDAALGRLLDALRARSDWDDTWVVVAADHGEGRGDNGEATHGVFCFDATIRVPLLVRHPRDEQAGSVATAPVSVVDVHPTLLAGLGLDIPPEIDGLVLAREATETARAVYFESYAGFFNYGWNPLVGLADASGVVLRSKTTWVGDASAVELRPVDAGEVAREDLLRGMTEALARAPRLEAEAGPVAASYLDELRQLGYTAVELLDEELPDPFADEGRLDALTSVAEHERTMQLTDRALEAGTDVPFDELEALLVANPRNLVVLEALGAAYVRAQRFSDAVRVLERLVALGPRGATSHTNLGLALLGAGDDERAIAVLEQAVALDPRHRPALVQLVRLYDKRGEREAARRYGELLKRAWD